MIQDTDKLKLYKMEITIARVNRTDRTSAKGNDYESLGIAPEQETLTDINGDEFSRDERWVNGFGEKGVTDDWGEGDIVKLNLVRVKVMNKEGNEVE